MLAFLLSNAQVGGRDETALLSSALGHFGEVAEEAEKLAAIAPPAALERTARTAWHDAIAEELLLLAQVNPEAARRLVGTFSAAHPFRHGPPLSALLGRSASAVVIPLDTGRGGQPGEWLHLWLVKDPEYALGHDDDRARLTGAAAWMAEDAQSGLKLFVVAGPTVTSPISGLSWELGAALARRALGSVHAAKLAARWVVTGRVSGGPSGKTTETVEPGNKSALAWIETRRSWIIPALNARTPEGHPADFGLKFVQDAYGRLQVAATVEAAWRHATGQGTLERSELDPWPADLPIFHGLVSGSLGPFLASILATQPKQLVLWCSDDMRGQGRALLATLTECVERRWLKSKLDLREATVLRRTPLRTDLVEMELVKDPSLNFHSPTKVHFNNTGGTFLMRLAVGTLAAARPHVRLLYRDVNDKGRNFTVLDYPNGRPVTGRSEIPETIHGANLTALLAVFPERGEPPADFQNRLLEAAGKRAA